VTKTSAMRVGGIKALQFAAAIAIVLWPARVWAQGGVHATFTPTIEQKLDARPTPAQVTSDNESALKSKGYVLIGTIHASVNGKKAESRITQQLQAAILQKAAQAGGDVVDFTEEGALVTSEEGTGKMKLDGATCAVPIQRPSCPSCREGCARWEGGTLTEIMKKVGILVSEGTVWRYAPNWTADLARAAEAIEAQRKKEAVAATRKAAEADAAQALMKADPVATRKAVTAAAKALPMLGKDINSAEMKAWLSNLGTPIIDRYSDSYYYSFKPEGISLDFTTYDMLQAIFFYSEGADGYNQYQDNLPFGLSFQNTRKEIESILGPPDSSGGDGVINYWASYRSKGIGIKYNTKRTDDMNARIYDMSISAVH